MCAELACEAFHLVTASDHDGPASGRRRELHAEVAGTADADSLVLARDLVTGNVEVGGVTAATPGAEATAKQTALS